MQNIRIYRGAHRYLFCSPTLKIMYQAGQSGGNNLTAQSHGTAEESLPISFNKVNFAAPQSKAIPGVDSGSFVLKLGAERYFFFP